MFGKHSSVAASSLCKDSIVGSTAAVGGGLTMAATGGMTAPSVVDAMSCIAGAYMPPRR